MLHLFSLPPSFSCLSVSFLSSCSLFLSFFLLLSPAVVVSYTRHLFCVLSSFLFVIPLSSLLPISSGDASSADTEALSGQEGIPISLQWHISASSARWDSSINYEDSILQRIMHCLHAAGRTGGTEVFRSVKTTRVFLLRPQM